MKDLRIIEVIGFFKLKCYLDESCFCFLLTLVKSNSLSLNADLMSPDPMLSISPGWIKYEGREVKSSWFSYMNFRSSGSLTETPTTI